LVDRFQRGVVPSPEDRPLVDPTSRRRNQLFTTAEINSSRFSPEIEEDENDEEELEMTTTREYRVEDIKQEIERLERRQSSSGGRISTNGSLTLGKLNVVIVLISKCFSFLRPFIIRFCWV
jgi:hypothetical protein